MTYYATTITDVIDWAARGLNLDNEQAERVGRAIWHRDDFPHPVNNTDIEDYLNELDADWLYEQAEATPA